MKEFTREYLLDRLSAFDDTEALTNWLWDYSEECRADGKHDEAYFLSECADSISGLYQDLRDFAHEINRLQFENDLTEQVDIEDI
ncbi:hypothetical protein AHY58_002138 [Salmonella enterica subsp. enterica]|nr:hypothetical protein [Salmonella enterica subsp. enterica serovar Mikawasima]